MIPDDACTGPINHSMVAIGLGFTPEGDEYVIVQNNWGEDWGEQGYFRVELTEEDRCGVIQQALKDRKSVV